MDGKKIAVIAGVAFILILFMGWLLMPRKASRPAVSPGEIQDSVKGDSGKDSADSGSSATSDSHGNYGTGHQTPGGTMVSAPGSRISGSGSRVESAVAGGIQAFTEEEVQALRNKREELRKSMYERKRDWLKAKASDSSLSVKSQVRHRLKLIDGFRSGNDAFNKGEYVEAMKQYVAGLKDPNADAATRYLCYHQMRNVARLLKDPDLYLEILREQGELIEKGDLAGLGIEKSNRGVLAYERRKLFVQALKGADGLKNSVDQYLRENGLSEKSRKNAEQEFIEDFEEWKRDFESPG